MALDPRAAMLKINQERMDVQKALAASQADMGKQMSKKGRKGAWGGWLGKLAAPVLADWGTTALLNVLAPGLGSLYKAAKGVPVLKAGAKGLLTAYGGAKGAEMGAGSVSVGESEDLMKKHMAGTVSGEKGMRFDRGATAAMESQKDLQLESLDDMMKQDAYKSGLKAVGSSLLGDLKGATSKGVSERIKSMRETGGDLTTQDYLSAFTESGKDARKQLLSTESLKDWSSKREGLSFGQAMKYSDEALTSPKLPTVPKVDMEYMNQQLGQDLGQPTRIAGEGSASGQFGDFAQGGIQKDDIWVSASGDRRIPDSFGVLPPAERAMGASPSSYGAGKTLRGSPGMYTKAGTPDEHFHKQRTMIQPYVPVSSNVDYMETNARQGFNDPGEIAAIQNDFMDFGYGEGLAERNNPYKGMDAPRFPNPAMLEEADRIEGLMNKPPLGYEKMLNDLSRTNSLQEAYRKQIHNPMQTSQGLFGIKQTFSGADKYSSLMNNNWYTKGYGEL